MESNNYCNDCIVQADVLTASIVAVKECSVTIVRIFVSYIAKVFSLYINLVKRFILSVHKVLDIPPPNKNSYNLAFNIAYSLY